jgi:hypothetical protein
VFYQPGFVFKEFLKMFPNVKAVARELSKVALKAVIHESDMEKWVPTAFLLSYDNASIRTDFMLRVADKLS